MPLSPSSLAAVFAESQPWHYGANTLMKAVVNRAAIIKFKVYAQSSQGLINFFFSLLLVSFFLTLCQHVKTRLFPLQSMELSRLEAAWR